MVALFQETPISSENLLKDADQKNPVPAVSPNLDLCFLRNLSQFQSFTRKPVFFSNLHVSIAPLMGWCEIAWKIVEVHI